MFAPRPLSASVGRTATPRYLLVRRKGASGGQQRYRLTNSTPSCTVARITYPEDADLLHVLAWCGLRLREAVGLQPGDVDDPAGSSRSSAPSSTGSLASGSSPRRASA